MNNQEKRARIACGKFYRQRIKGKLIIDDETYVPFFRDQIPGQEYYHSQKDKKIMFRTKINSNVKKNLPKSSWFGKQLMTEMKVNRLF